MKLKNTKSLSKKQLIDALERMIDRNKGLEIEIVSYQEGASILQTKIMEAKQRELKLIKQLKRANATAKRLGGFMPNPHCKACSDTGEITVRDAYSNFAIATAKCPCCAGVEGIVSDFDILTEALRIAAIQLGKYTCQNDDESIKKLLGEFLRDACINIAEERGVGYEDVQIRTM